MTGILALSITCAGLGGSVESNKVFVQVDLPTLSIKLVDPQPASTGIAGMRLYVMSNGAKLDSATVGANGVASLREPINMPASVDACFDAVDRTHRVYHAVCKPLAKSVLEQGTDSVVLVPKIWQIQVGTFAGQSVAIDLEKAFSPAYPPGDSLSFYSYTPLVVSGMRVYYLRRWDLSLKPFNLAFSSNFTSSDSAWVKGQLARSSAEKCVNWFWV